MALPLCGRAGRENDIFKTAVAYFPTLVISLSSGVWLCINSVFAVILTQYLDHLPIKPAHAYFMGSNSLGLIGVNALCYSTQSKPV